uniref:Uncharacterized protein n=1 Tax=Ulva partita TaxID=1605170 RepID=A0A1C9ZWI1_9CHLO|nr:hypothetical protein [Ulva partita]
MYFQMTDRYHGPHKFSQSVPQHKRYQEHHICHGSKPLLAKFGRGELATGLYAPSVQVDSRLRATMSASL